MLFYNPDLFHDLTVFKCATAIVFTSADRGNIDNLSLSTERSLEAALAWMSSAIGDTTIGEKGVIQIGEKSVADFTFNSVPNVHILYFRLPGGEHTGEGYKAHNEQSLKKLYTGEITVMTSTDGVTTYTLDQINEIIAIILHERQMNDIRVLNYKAVLPEEQRFQKFRSH